MLVRCNLHRVPAHATLQFFGAAGEVTGSCTLLTTPRARVLIDFGLFQGSFEQELRNAVAPDLDFASIDAVVVTHAHVDHCGRLGMLPALGCGCGIWCTDPTAELLPRVLRSSASLQRMRLEEFAQGTSPEARVIEPAHLAVPHKIRPAAPPALYSELEARATARMIRAVAYSEWAEVADGVRIRMHDASHVIGSASVEIECEYLPGKPRVLLSGDIGPTDGGLLAPHGGRGIKADVVVMESTNGARLAHHQTAAKQIDSGTGVESRRSSQQAAAGNSGAEPQGKSATTPPSAVLRSTLEEVITSARREGRQLLFPVFALGRAQLLLHRMSLLAKRGILGDLPVFVDSAMAVRVCGVYTRHPTLLHSDAAHAIACGENPLSFSSSRPITSAQGSKVIAEEHGGCAILAGSGFCDAGPILRHLRRMLPSERATIVFAGHQIDGSLAHGLAHGASRVVINGEEIRVRAEIVRVDGLSGHASPDDLLQWLSERAHARAQIVLNHGTDHARDTLTRQLGNYSTTVSSPQVNETTVI